MDNKKPKEKPIVQKSEERSPKKRRMSEEKPKPVEESTKPSNNIGSLIGRKRKEKKGGKKGSR